MSDIAPSRALRLAIDDPRWTSFVAAAPGATPFHHPAWARTLSRTYGYPAFAVAGTDGNGRLLAGLPCLEIANPLQRRRWVSLPFTDECPPLAAPDVDRRELAVELARALAGLRAPTVEVRDSNAGLGWSTRCDAVIHELRLDGGEARVRSRFSRSQVVRNIARAERERVVVRRAQNRADLELFYGLHTRTRRRQGVPVQPRRFFELLWSDLIERGLGFILLADVGDRPAVAGALFLTGGDTTIYKFGASDRDSWRYRPNHLIFWTAIREACARGQRRFDFGRTDLDNPGLGAFKRGWGADERPLVYSSWHPARQGPAGLPGRALKTTIRRSPTWVCRGAGTALYRYAASR